jgi:hypothetical protein
MGIAAGYAAPRVVPVDYDRHRQMPAPRRIERRRPSLSRYDRQSLGNDAGHRRPDPRASTARPSTPASVTRSACWSMWRSPKRGLRRRRRGAGPPAIYGRVCGARYPDRLPAP